MNASPVVHNISCNVLLHAVLPSGLSAPSLPDVTLAAGLERVAVLSDVLQTSGMGPYGGHHRRFVPHCLTALTVLLTGSASMGQQASWQAENLVREAPDTLPLVVESLNEQAREIGLTASAIERFTTEYLESSEITAVPSTSFTPDGAYLYVNVLVVGEAASVDVSFERSTSFDYAGETRTAVSSVWSQGGLTTWLFDDGIQDRRVLDLLGEVLELFVADYVSVNTLQGSAGTASARTGTSNPLADRFGAPSGALPVLSTANANPRFAFVPGSITGQLGDEEVRIGERAVDLYALQALTPGDFVTVTMKSARFDTFLMQVDPGSMAIRASNDDAGSLQESELTLRVPNSGRVWIAASSFLGNAEGMYTIRMQRAD